MSRKPMNYEAIAGTESEALREITLGRLDNFLNGANGFSDVSFTKARFYKERLPIAGLRVYSPPVEPPLNGRIPFRDVPPLNDNDSWRPLGSEDLLGPTWSTHWIQVPISIPPAWNGQEIHLVFNTGTEAMVWTTSGEPLQGLTGQVPGLVDAESRLEFILPVREGSIVLLLEVAINSLFGNGTPDNKYAPPDPNLYVPVQYCDIGLFDRDAFDMRLDMVTIYDMATQLPEDKQFTTQLLRLANALVNVVNPNDRSTWPRARKLIRTIWEKNQRKKATSPLVESKEDELLSEVDDLLPLPVERHHLSAIGHCHIDSAWLWPYAETRRKVARSWSTQLDLMQRYPNFKFVASQACQYQWLKEDYPGLFERVRAATVNPNIGFSHIGGTWTEMDTNMPCGESLVRQFLLGQRFYEREFGRRSCVFWLPDTFGYSAQLPQIVRSAGIEYFLTQKLSWNNINKMPHHTFFWEGLDGSEILTHFPPTDTYNAEASVKDILYNEQNYKDKASTNESMLVFGVGDGGGGPQARMIETLERLRDVDGLPSVDMEFPDAFFDRLKEKSDNLTNWVGELYFELHRGTYTSQAATKRRNRECEQLMKTAEFLSVVAQSSVGLPYPSAIFTKCWENICVNQFHDTLPGSAIGEVYDEASDHYDFVDRAAGDAIEASLAVLSGAVPTDKGQSQVRPQRVHQDQHVSVWNSLSFPRTELVEIPAVAANSSSSHRQGSAFSQTLSNGNELRVFSAPSLGYETAPLASSQERQCFGTTSISVRRTESQRVFTLANDFVEADFTESGHISRLYDHRAKRDLIPKGSRGNVFVIFDDIPLRYDAWDVEIYHLQTRREIGDALSAEIVEDGPLRVSVEFTFNISPESSIRQRVSLAVTSPRIDFELDVDWHENRKVLKVEYPVAIRSDFASYEVAYGTVQRPTVANTTVDIAKFEVCMHRWMDLSEHGFGVALLNNSKYGASCHRNVMRLTLLKAPKSPDDQCDMGRHVIQYAMFPHQGDYQTGRVVQEAHALNNRLLVKLFDRSSSTLVDGSRSFFSVLDTDAVLLDAVKRAEDSESALILRLYEAHGSHATARIKVDLDTMPSAANFCNILEDDIDSGDEEPLRFDDGELTVAFSPFQMRSIKLTFGE